MTAPRTVGLVACGASKLDHPAPAAQLYTSQLFRSASAYAARTYDAWYVISARHHLVAPTTELAPYDQALPQRGDMAGRSAWGLVVVQRLILAEPDQPLQVWLHAGANYCHPIARAVKALDVPGWELRWPMRGLFVGQQLRWYALRRPEPQGAA